MSKRYPDYPLIIERYMFYAFSIIAAISVLEVLLDSNLMSVIYPASEILSYMQADRFRVSSIFVNFNDFSTAMIIYTLQLLSRLKNARKPTPKLTYFAMFIFVFGICFYMGSRGYLVSLILYLAIRLYLWSKVTFSKSVSRLLIISFLMLLLMSIFLLASFLSSYVLDNSNMKRIWIFSNYFKMIFMDIEHFIYGFGGYLNYQELARFDCSECTVDPHNLFLELAIAYGGGAFFAFLFLYINTSLYFLKNAKYFNEAEKILTYVFMLTIISGTIPSSTLKYYYIFFIIVAIPAIRSNVKKRQSLISYTPKIINNPINYD